VARKPSSFHPIADREAEREFRYYHRREAGLGHAFNDELEQALIRALEMPETRPPVAVLQGEIVRASRLRRFPFCLIFVHRSSEVRVLAVAHDRRRPLYWAGRLRS
jgi:plasmid stabilization system protein ParE